MYETTFLKFRCIRGSCDFIMYVENKDDNKDHSCTQCGSMFSMHLEYETKLEEK